MAIKSLSQLRAQAEAIRSEIAPEANTASRVGGHLGDAIDTLLYQAGRMTLYTYIVDSNEALAEWAAATPGNDYTNVLIRKGTWTSQREINLTAAGTKTVTGEAGSLLSFSNANGLRYDDLPQSTDHWMFGVNVRGYNSGQGFYRCANLFMCSADVTGNGFYCYDGCRNLVDCRAVATATGSYGFYAFTDCDRMTNPVVDVSSPGNYGGIGIAMSRRIAGAQVNMSSAGTVQGIYNCDEVSSAHVRVESTSSQAYAIASCRDVCHCKAAGVAPQGQGIAFLSCRVMFGNSPLEPSSTVTYTDCYMNTQGTANPVADTAAGGYNRS